jgi:DNA-directed RNA polymerase specialized sigma24 family protein
MLVDDPRIRELVKRVIGRWVNDPVNRDDLIQEALIHLWLIEEERPGQQVSWYLQSCRYHVGKFIRAGRSIDSPKRHGGRISLDADAQADTLVTRENDDDGGAQLRGASASELIEKLSARLEERDMMILRGLASGQGAREIARALHVSHPSIVKRRQKIARLARRLGFDRLQRAAGSAKGMRGASDGCLGDATARVTADCVAEANQAGV